MWDNFGCCQNRFLLYYNRNIYGSIDFLKLRDNIQIISINSNKSDGCLIVNVFII